MFKYKQIIPLFFLTTFMILCGKNSLAQEINPLYDSTLAQTLGADNYGMKQYIFVILKTGSNDVQDKSIRDSLFAGHFGNMKKLADEGKLFVAGPFFKNDKSYRGLFILNVQSIDEAKILLDDDPTIKEKIFEVELFQWYGSAALGEYLDVHKKISKFDL